MQYFPGRGFYIAELTVSISLNGGGAVALKHGAAMEISFTVDFKDVAQQLAVEYPKQVSFAMAKTLSALARDGMDAVVKQLPIAFDRPTGFTLKAPAREDATKASQQSRVFLKESGDQAGGKYDYLQPGVHGASARHQKRAEMLLTRNGWLPPGYITVPGKAMPIDPATGAMAGSYYRQIVNILQLKVIESKSARKTYAASVKRTKKLGVEAEMFVAQPGNRLSTGGGRLPPGVYKHLPGRKLLQMLKFVPRAAYTARFDFDKTVTDAVTANAEKRWAESSDFATRSAKP